MNTEEVCNKIKIDFSNDINQLQTQIQNQPILEKAIEDIKLFLNSIHILIKYDIETLITANYSNCAIVFQDEEVVNDCAIIGKYWNKFNIAVQKKLNELFNIKDIERKNDLYDIKLTQLVEFCDNLFQATEVVKIQKGKNIK